MDANRQMHQTRHLMQKIHIHQRLGIPAIKILQFLQKYLYTTIAKSDITGSIKRWRPYMFRELYRGTY